MKSKLMIRLVVLAAIFAWPLVESYRLWETRQQLAASTRVERKVSLRLADARNKAGAEMTRTAATETR